MWSGFLGYCFWGCSSGGEMECSLILPTIVFLPLFARLHQDCIKTASRPHPDPSSPLPLSSPFVPFAIFVLFALFSPFIPFVSFAPLQLHPLRPLQHFENPGEFLDFQNFSGFHYWVWHANCTWSNFLFLRLWAGIKSTGDFSLANCCPFVPIWCFCRDTVYLFLLEGVGFGRG